MLPFHVFEYIPGGLHCKGWFANLTLAQEYIWRCYSRGYTPGSLLIGVGEFNEGGR